MDPQSRCLRFSSAGRPASVPNTHTFTKYDANAKPYGDTDAYSNTYSNASGESNAQCHTQSDTQAAANSTSSADSEVDSISD